MTERKRFQTQTLNSEDYATTEKGAKAVKTGGKILGIVAVSGLMFKKYGNHIIKSLGKIRKI